MVGPPGLAALDDTARAAAGMLGAAKTVSRPPADPAAGSATAGMRTLAAGFSPPPRLCRRVQHFITRPAWTR